VGSDHPHGPRFTQKNGALNGKIIEELTISMVNDGFSTFLLE
jgi:hypothetical protein